MPYLSQKSYHTPRMLTKKSITLRSLLFIHHPSGKTNHRGKYHKYPHTVIMKMQLQNFSPKMVYFVRDLDRYIFEKFVCFQYPHNIAYYSCSFTILEGFCSDTSRNIFAVTTSETQVYSVEKSPKKSCFVTTFFWRMRGLGAVAFLRRREKKTTLMDIPNLGFISHLKISTLLLYTSHVSI